MRNVQMAKHRKCVQAAVVWVMSAAGPHGQVGHAVCIGAMGQVGRRGRKGPHPRVAWRASAPLLLRVCTRAPPGLVLAGISWD